MVSALTSTWLRLIVPGFAVKFSSRTAESQPVPPKLSKRTRPVSAEFARRPWLLSLGDRTRGSAHARTEVIQTPSMAGPAQSRRAVPCSTVATCLSPRANSNQLINAPLLHITQHDAATNIEDIDLPGFDLHPLHGQLAGKWAVSVNGNWRLTSEFHGSDAENLNYEDYH